MTSTLRAFFAFAAPCFALVTLASGCAVDSDLSEPVEHVGTVTSGTLTVDHGEDAGASSTPASPASPAPGDAGGTFEVPSTGADAGEADAGRGPLGN